MTTTLVVHSVATMSRLIEFYKTQVRILWEWRGGRVALLKRLVITFIVAVISFIITAGILPGIMIGRLVDAAIAVILMTLFNSLIRPVILALVAPISLVLTGILVLVLQVLTFLVIVPLAPGVEVNGFLPALVGSFIYAAVNTVLTSIFAIDSGGSYFGLLVSTMMAKRATTPTDQPGLVIVQIDGLAHPILAGRVRAGSVNVIGSWIRDGSHKLSRWEAILPSMTSASQAGILHGNNDGIPAFRWYERDRQHLMVSSNPEDAAEIVRRVSDGEGLLSNNGVSICNLMTGDATRAYVTTAAIKDQSQGIGDSKAFLGFFFSPNGYLRSFTLFMGEFITERIQARRTRRSGIVPQMHRGFKYAGMRAASNVLLRDVNVSLIIEEMYRGANVIYADFTDYDELAHHCGPERVESFQALDGVDQAIGTLAKAAENAPRPYKFVVLSDHGQSLGRDVQAALRQEPRRGRPRPDERARHARSRRRPQGEGSTFVNSFLSEITRSKGVGPTVARAALANSTTDGVVDLDHEEIPPPADESTIAVVGLGQPRARVVHRPRPPPDGRGARGPASGAGVDAGRASGRRRADGPLVGARRRRLRADAASATSTRTGSRARTRPTLFGEHTIMSLKREDAMTHAPDLLLLSQYDPEMGEVAAFEELIGSHGGLGGFQTQPFILHPKEWELDEPVPLGAPAIYRNIRRWLGTMGIELGKPAAAPPAVEPVASAPVAAEASWRVAAAPNRPGATVSGRPSGAPCRARGAGRTRRPRPRGERPR